MGGGWLPPCHGCTSSWGKQDSNVAVMRLGMGMKMELIMFKLFIFWLNIPLHLLANRLLPIWDIILGIQFLHQNKHYKGISKAFSPSSHLPRRYHNSEEGRFPRSHTPKAWIPPFSRMTWLLLQPYTTACAWAGRWYVLKCWCHGGPGVADASSQPQLRELE
ncbi:uncharacterized protein LACBIDRAFT_315704 [Laccaria bicolor S238N-H82]|uniref:Predicted protein n=1 Tax=Laccaria bicolor (strain S238N-H82 / ATCC MYA-4686) TaxID=486041 RepID=B0D2Z6_LACBS|nr:uncharacterized protein LACBIDRAFT_315704 [Laccaria bicolor S238N-H82]EDR11183.1 predicted protein [Laccaria bicolor S238N-H82]|eukprot:XP_001878484.1 predicted protein [Laccaria bicolor S238N-H82]